MKKLTSVILALLLTFSFGLTVMAGTPEPPATQGEEVGTSSNVTNGSGSTAVKVIYSSNSGQISATVPISITFAVKNDKTFVYPTTDTYKIVNNSVVPVYVSNIAVVFGSADYKLVNAAPAANEDYNEIQLSMTAGTDTINLVGDVASLDSNSTPINQTIGDGTKWNIAAGGNLPINFSNGKVYEVDSAWVGSAATLFSIVYTISTGSAT